MKLVLALVATVAVASIGCGGESTEAPPPAPPPPPPVAPAPPPAPAAETPPPAPAKQLVTMTTKSPDAKAALAKAFALNFRFRFAEAQEQAKAALAADPDFALAHAFLGDTTAGAVGEAENDKGVKLAASLPDGAEKLLIQAMGERRHRDMAKGNADMKRVADLAGDDPIALSEYGFVLFDGRDFAGAQAAFTKAVSADPTADYAYGLLAWTAMQLKNYDDMLANAKKYVDAAPNDPTAHQVLANALLNKGQTKDAEGELGKALELGPKARAAYTDYAVVKTLDGDYAGARDLLDKAKVADQQPSDALDRAVRAAWVTFAEGKTADAFKALDVAEKDADAQKYVWPAMPAAARAWASYILGKPADALKFATAGMPRCDRAESSTAYKADCRRELLSVTALAQIASKKPADARKTLAKLDDELKGAFQGNDWARVEADILSDETTALEKKDKTAAAAVFAKCPPDDFLYKLSALRLATGFGDKAAVEQIKTDLAARPETDPPYPLVVKTLKK